MSVLAQGGGELMEREGGVIAFALEKMVYGTFEADWADSDYHFDIGPNHTRSIKIVDPPGAQLIFLVARCRAMASGDPAAVNMMLSIIKFMSRHGMMDLTPKQISTQLERDYRVKIHEVRGVIGAGEFVLPTKQENEEERAYQRQRLDTAIYSEEGVVHVGPFTPPTRREVEEHLAYQDGKFTFSMFKCPNGCPH
ncbi:hypothetical protein B0H13DRAFT_2312208 [Mycena leptocephala]|nr:hypothetical protein B0H13DRAFT_2312208 [Mycena leptocephala]